MAANDYYKIAKSLSKVKPIKGPYGASYYTGQLLQWEACCKSVARHTSPEVDLRTFYAHCSYGNYASPETTS